MLIKKDTIREFFYKKDFDKKSHDRMSTKKPERIILYYDIKEWNCLIFVDKKITFTIYEDMVCKKYIGGEFIPENFKKK